MFCCFLHSAAQHCLSAPICLPPCRHSKHTTRTRPTQLRSATELKQRTRQQNMRVGGDAGGDKDINGAAVRRAVGPGFVSRSGCPFFTTITELQLNKPTLHQDDVTADHHSTISLMTTGFVLQIRRDKNTCWTLYRDCNNAYGLYSNGTVSTVEPRRPVQR